MPISPLVLAAGSLALGVAGTAVSVHGQSQAASAQRRAEEQRKKAMELDAQRRKMEIVRNQQRAQAMSLATTTAQGASYGSGLPGALGQISGQSNFAQSGVNQNLEIGRNIFDANMQSSQGQQMAGIGSGLSSLGGVGMQSLDAFGRLKRSNWGQGYDYNDPTRTSGYY